MEISRRQLFKLGISSGVLSWLIKSRSIKTLIDASNMLFYKAPVFEANSVKVPNFLDVITLIGLPEDQQIMFVSLQGIVNKTQPKIYVLQDDQEGRLTWLNDLGIPHRFWSSPWELLSFYKTYVKGIVIWDPALTDTINVATNLAALYDLIIVSPELIEPANNYGVAGSIIDLRDKFSNSYAVYKWASKTIWPYCNDSIIFGISPQEPTGPPPVIEQQFFGQFFPQFPENQIPSGLSPNGFLRDFAIVTNGKCFSFNPTVFKEREFFQSTLELQGNHPIYMGWFPSGAQGGEDDGVQLLSKNAVCVFASDFFSNMSVFWAVNSQITPQQQIIYTGTYQNKIYLTFTFSDGDNLQYDQHRLRQIWDDPNRGLYPLNWTISPSLAIFAPYMMSYYLNTASANDLLIAGPSGNGYCYPNLWPTELIGNYIFQSTQAMNMSGLKIVNILNRNNGQDENLTSSVASLYDSIMAPEGVLLNWDATQNVSILGKSTPAINGILVGSTTEAVSYLSNIENNFNGTKPIFVSVGLYAFNLSPTDVKTIVSNLNTNMFTILRADQFFYYLRQYLGL